MINIALADKLLKISVNLIARDFLIIFVERNTGKMFYGLEINYPILKTVGEFTRVLYNLSVSCAQ